MKTPTHRPIRPKTKRPPKAEDRRHSAPRPAITPKAQSSERLNRYLARCGLCSRREADRWITAGRIAINGVTVKALGTLVATSDTVSVDGKQVSQVAHFTYLIYHKPRGMLCSRKDDQGRPLIFDELDVAANVQSVGRLDMNSEGLLLLTNDGDLAQQLAHPSSRIPRTYRVRVGGNVELGTLERLRQGGIDLGEGEKSDPWQVSVDAESGGHTWLTVILHRGRWREVRRTLEACGHPVRRLIRTHFGPIALEDQPRSAVRPLRARELRALNNMITQAKKETR